MGYTENDFVNADMKLYILITGFDDVFSSPVSRRTSYTVCMVFKIQKNDRQWDGIIGRWWFHEAI
jgi:hypothetical protein